MEDTLGLKTKGSVLEKKDEAIALNDETSEDEIPIDIMPDRTFIEQMLPIFEKMSKTLGEFKTKVSVMEKEYKITDINSVTPEDVSPMKRLDDSATNNEIITKVNRMEEILSEFKTKVSVMEDKDDVIAEHHEWLKDQETQGPICHNNYVYELFKITSSSEKHASARGKYTKLQRMVWSFIHIVPLLICSAYIQDAYTNWQNVPVVQSTVSISAKKIPFPAITICKPVTLKKDYDRDEILHRCLRNLTSGPWRCSEKELDKFLVSMDVSYLKTETVREYRRKRVLKEFRERNYKYLTRIAPQYLNRTYGGSEYIKYIDEISEGCFQLKIYHTDIDNSIFRTVNLCDNTTKTSFFLGKLQQFNDSPISKCLTLNGLGIGVERKRFTEMNSSHSFKNISHCNPDKILDADCNHYRFYSDKYLEIELVENDAERRIEISSEYFAIVHSTFDYPSSAKEPLQFSYPGQHRYRIIPILQHVNNELLTFQVSKRNCIFSFEKKLSLFEQYTYDNCIMECQIHCALKLCGCVPFSIAILNSSLNICSNIKSENCLITSDFFLHSEYKDDRCKCDCPLGCVSIKNSVQKHSFFSFVTTNKSIIRFTYDSPEYRSYLRHSVTSLTEFVSYSLGILGVFNGLMKYSLKILNSLTFLMWSSIKRINSKERVDEIVVVARNAFYKRVFAIVKRMEVKLSEIRTKVSFLDEKAKSIEGKVETPGAEVTIIPSFYSSYFKKAIESFKSNWLQNLFTSEYSHLLRIVWISIHILALSVSSVYILYAYINWQNSPVTQVVVDTKVKDIPFPAITVCKQVALRKDYDRSEVLYRCLGNLTNGTWRCSEEELNMFLVSLDIRTLKNVSQEEYNRKTGLYRNYFTSFDYSTRLLPKIVNRTFSGSEYLKYVDTMSEGCLDVNVYTEEINYVKMHAINLCNNGNDSSFYLGRVFNLGIVGIFKCLTLNSVSHGVEQMSYNEDPPTSSTNHSSTCNPDSILGSRCNDELFHTEGFFHVQVPTFNVQYYDKQRMRFPTVHGVLYHHPFDYPSFTSMPQLFLLEPLAQYYKMQPILVNSKEEISTLEVQKRDCIFSFEKNLTMLRYYTYNNCIKECQINCALKLCGCVPFSVAIFNSSIKICNRLNLDICLKTSDFLLDSDFKDVKCKCDCLPHCIDLRYQFALAATTSILTGVADLQIRPDRLLIQSEFRYSATSPTDFVAYALGILGVFTFVVDILFLMFKIFYLLTFRLWSIIKRKNSVEKV